MQYLPGMIGLTARIVAVLGGGAPVAPATDSGGPVWTYVTTCAS